jgi:uncharacterized protein YggE
MYINGEIAKSGSYAGKVMAHSDDKVATAFCLGADITASGTGDEFPMTDFALTDVKIYSDALNYKQVEAAYNNAVAEFSK